jgi:hypothetical protein
MPTYPANLAYLTVTVPHTQGWYLFFMFYIELLLYFFTNKHIESFILRTTAGLNFFLSLSVALTVSNRRIQATVTLPKWVPRYRYLPTYSVRFFFILKIRPF